MVHPNKPRLGVSDDPAELQPALNDCLQLVLQQSSMLVTRILQGLQQAGVPGPQRLAGFDKGRVRQAIDDLNFQASEVLATFHAELSRLIYEGGGKDQGPAELLRFEELKLFEDEELDASIEVARAQYEVFTGVDDVLPTLDALVSTMLGWRTIQPGLNPVRPDVFVRALQHTLAVHVPDSKVRESLITPAAGLLGVGLRKIYKELADWLASTGVEQAVPVGGRRHAGAGATGAAVSDSAAKTLLTLDKLRKLLAGDFDGPSPRPDDLLTVPASMAMLKGLKGGADALVERLQQRPKPPAPSQPVDMLAAMDEQQQGPRIGQQLGREVVRLMFDNLTQDQRLLPGLKSQLRALEPAIQQLAEQDSRFFSDRNHHARQLLDRIVQRSLAFTAETDDGWPRFLRSVGEAAAWMDSKVVDSETVGELLDALHRQWSLEDQQMRHNREEAARALLHAEQRNLLAQKIAKDFEQQLRGVQVAPFVIDFLKGAWANVLAEVQLTCATGETDPFGYRQLVNELIWSVQKSTAQRGRARRLVDMIPALLTKLQEGLDRIGYPPRLTARFFDNLLVLHRDAVHDGRDAETHAAADSAWHEPSEGDLQADVWLDAQETAESGFMRDIAPAVVPGAAPLEAVGLQLGAWVEIFLDGTWLRAQLTWCSPHGTLFMFTSQVGTAHSMSRRTLERLRAVDQLEVIAERNVVDEALDQVARAALRNSLK